MQKKSSKLKFVFGLLLFLFAFSVNAEERGRSYYYDSFKVDIQVNEDTTFNVEEKQTYKYVGRYNKGWRSVWLKDVSAITEVEVIDGATGLPLEHSSKILEKTDPSNWGKYTFYKKNGAMNVEWYYDLADTTHEWIIKYKVYGGIGFYKDHDEVYWNLFTDFDVPINSYEATIKIPDNNSDVSKLTVFNYSQDVEKQASVVDNQTFYFKGSEIYAGGAATIAAGWPKGLISQSAFWLGWFKINIIPIASGLTIFICIIIGFIYWYLTERRNQGRGTIIPRYEPPQNLRPAMAELICKEKITLMAWPATIVDLAVRGYIAITDNKKKYWIFTIPDFVLEKAKDIDSASGLEDYEKKYLSAIFAHAVNGKFSTAEMQKYPTLAQELYENIKEVERGLLEETEQDTGAYEKPLSREKVHMATVPILFMAFITLFLAFNSGWIDFNYIFIVTATLAIFGLFLFVKFEARLNKQGQILREDWLGFKMFLEATGKDRMQNLTPEIFEKYLPYAMIFGVEKQWAKNFEGMHMPPPNWYHSNTAAFLGANSLGSNGISEFSPSAFSSSFASSFSSAFSSSAGGGGAGGGGAGGGGGGGGGGAS